MNPDRTSQARVSVETLARAFRGVQAVRNATFSVAAGEIHALCGHNGAGKSTVVRMLSGQLEPDSGVIRVDGRPTTLRSRQAAQRVGVALVDQEISVVPTLTVVENLLLGDIGQPFVNRRRAARSHCRKVLDGMGMEYIDLDALVGSLTLGERQLIEIAKALSQHARLVILDEPTATLSDVESTRVYEAVRRVAAGGCAVLFISHRLSEVLTLCDHVTVLRDGETVATTATADLTIDTLIRQMLGDSPHRLESAARTDAEVVFEVADLSVPGRVKNFAIRAGRGSICALAGQVGSGTSDVLRALGGLIPDASGTVRINGREHTLRDPVRAVRSGITFVGNDRKLEGLFLDSSVAQNLVATRLSRVATAGVVRPRAVAHESRRVATYAGIPEDRLPEAVGALSGGNQQKVFVGRGLARDDLSVLLLDEPTRGVDVGGRSAIHAMLRTVADDGITVIFASTELDELMELADVIVTMRDGEVVSSYQGEVDGAVLLRDMTKAEVRS